MQSILIIILGAKSKTKWIATYLKVEQLSQIIHNFHVSSLCPPNFMILFTSQSTHYYENYDTHIGIEKLRPKSGKKIGMFDLLIELQN